MDSFKSACPGDLRTVDTLKHERGKMQLSFHHSVNAVNYGGERYK